VCVCVCVCVRACVACVRVALQFGDTPLMYASLRGHTSAVEELAKAGADVTLKSQVGTAVLLSITCALLTSPCVLLVHSLLCVTASASLSLPLPLPM
jgi:ankyrin repeat protein